MAKRVAPDNAYNAIKNKITSGEYYPSQRLVEEQVARELSMSRHNVRAGLQRLESDGLVKIEPNRGATVASMSLEQALDTLSARKILEIEITRAAAERISDELLHTLQGYLKDMSDFLEQHRFDDYSQTNRMFHKMLYEVSGKPTIAWLIGLLRERMARMQMRTILIPGRSLESLKEHAAILDAMEMHNPDNAAAAAAAHIDNLAKIVESSWGLVRS